MDLKLEGKTALVTGASRGIGAEIARELAAHGCRVILAARTRGDLDAVAGEIRAKGGQAAPHAVDLREVDAPANLVSAALADFGALDIVVGNAGATKRADFLELTDADWQDGFALKFFGHVRLARAAWPFLKASGGSLVLIAGVGGRTPGAEFTIGGSVNAALLSLTKALADRGIADGIQVNAVNPGAIATDRLTKRIAAIAKADGVSTEEAARRMVRALNSTRFGETADIAGLVAFIVGARGRYLHGAMIDMDGGQTKTL